MSPELPACFIHHLAPSLHIAFNSTVYGFDCIGCPKVPELLAFFKFLGESTPLFLGP